MPPSAKDSEFAAKQVDGQGFPSVNGSRRRQPPPKLKKPVPHYRHLVRWNKDKVPDSVEEQQMNQDLVILRHILDLFLNSRMAEAEAILAKGVVPVGEGLPVPGAAATGAATGASVEKAAEANQASNNNNSSKDDDASSVTSSSAPSTAPSSANNSNNKDGKSEKKSTSQSSSTSSSKKGGPKEVRSMYFELAKGIIQGLRALVTFDPFEIEAGMKAFEQAIKTADKQRKGSMLGLGSVKAVGSFVVGTIGAGSFKGMNRVQKHAVSLVWYGLFYYDETDTPDKC
jgi:hypothetical protein